MQYRGRDFLFDDETGEEVPATGQELPADKEFRRKRSIRAKRRSAKKPANRPDCGIGAPPQQSLDLVGKVQRELRPAETAGYA